MTQAPEVREHASPSVAPGAGRRRLGTIPALDGLRGLAVLLVVILHTTEITLPDATGIDVLDAFIGGGFFGVDLFFVLSGFLITALLSGEVDRTGRLGYRGFYARRALRLLPALYLLLLAHFAFALGSGMDLGREVASQLAALLYVTNWQVAFAPDTTVSHFGHLWSLAIEEQFYLLWPVVLVGFLGPRESTRTVLRILVPVILAVALWRAWLVDSRDWVALFVRSDTRVDELLIGALAALLWTRGRVPSRGLAPAAWVASAVLLAIILTTEADHRALYLGRMTAFAVAAAVVVLALVDGRWSGRRLFDLRPLRALGQVSYGVYLWHYPVFLVCARATALPTGLRVVLALTITAGVVVVSWRFVERPALQLKDRLGDRRQAVAPEPALRGRRRPLAAGAAVVLAAGLTGLVVGTPDLDASVVRFRAGDVDRSTFWAYAGLEVLAMDAFDGEAAPLGDAEEGGSWTAVNGVWERRDGKGAVTGDGDVLVAVAPGAAVDNGLNEVTLSTVQPGAGLVFRYRDALSYWSVTVAPDGARWLVERVADGATEVVGELGVVPAHGNTVTVVQNGSGLRILVDGVDRYSRVDAHLQDRLQAGLILRGAGDGSARWDRFLVMQVAGR